MSWYGSQPDVNSLTVTTCGAEQVAVVEGIDDLRVTRMGTTPGAVYLQLGASDERFESVPE
ncbi:MAG TPA: hypothetical protein EYQ31_08090 [Candidatus Handelsmanbacteria bacterium]|nr:hypothetical protein [Candidatus Handelsmanbacteria bacterium]